MNRKKLAALTAASLLCLSSCSYDTDSIDPNSLQGWLYNQGEQQEQVAEDITDDMVDSFEGEGGIAPEDEVDGSNWSIPNILRHLLNKET